MALYCPDCGVHGRLVPQYDEEGDGLIGFECDRCHMLFDDPSEDDDGDWIHDSDMGAR